jgi:hypothetical protein
MQALAQEIGTLASQGFPVLRKMVTGLPKFGVEHQGVCRGCALGKNAKVAFPSSDSISKEILDLVHSDVCGPMSVPYSSGYGIM